MRVLTLMCVCLFCVCYDTCACVKVRAGLCIGVLEPHIFGFLFFFALLAAAVAVSCLYRTVPQTLNLLCGSQRSTAVAQQGCLDHYPLTMCVD